MPAEPQSNINGAGPTGVFTIGYILLSIIDLYVVDVQPLFKSFATKVYPVPVNVLPGVKAMYDEDTCCCGCGDGPDHT